MPSFSPWTGTPPPAHTLTTIEGKHYDFVPFEEKHPGGAIWLRWNRARDITVVFHVYHKDSQRLRPLLEKYHVAKPNIPSRPNDGAPPFLFLDGYDPVKDLPDWKFGVEGTFHETVKKACTTQKHLEVVARMDNLFDLCCYFMLCLFAAIHVARQMDILPWYVCGFLLACTRTGLGGWGHYYVHQKKPNLLEGLFDINYVGASLIGMDGHLAHHAITQTPLDPKRTFFYGMLKLHKYWRVFGYTMHKIGLLCSGMVIRGFEVQMFEFDKGNFRTEFWLVRAVMFAELVLCWCTGQMWFFSMQFLLSAWFNTFMIVASHDFEEPHYMGKETDWAKFQLENSFDFTIVGNRWLDLVFSAGLSPHRCHHILPFQKSGFANLASEKIVRETVEKFGMEWKPARNFWTERLPALMKHYLLSDALDPQTRKVKGTAWYAPSSIIDVGKYIFQGFIGVGAV